MTVPLVITLESIVGQVDLLRLENVNPCNDGRVSNTLLSARHSKSDGIGCPQYRNLWTLFIEIELYGSRSSVG